MNSIRESDVSKTNVLSNLVLALCLLIFPLGGSEGFCANGDFALPEEAKWIEYHDENWRSHTSDVFYRTKKDANSPGWSHIYYFNKHKPNEEFHKDFVMVDNGPSDNLKKTVRLYHEWTQATDEDKERIKNELKDMMDRLSWNEEIFLAGSEIRLRDLPDVFDLPSEGQGVHETSFLLYTLPEPTALVLPKGQRRLYYGCQCCGGGSASKYSGVVGSLRGTLGYSPFNRLAIELSGSIVGGWGALTYDFDKKSSILGHIKDGQTAGGARVHGDIRAFFYLRMNNDEGLRFYLTGGIKGSNVNWSSLSKAGAVYGSAAMSYQFSQCPVEVGINLGGMLAHTFEGAFPCRIYVAYRKVLFSSED